jgi:WXXGXW repeat (2 copies)
LRAGERSARRDEKEMARRQLMKLNLTARWFVLGFLLLSIPAVLALPASAQFGVSISVRIGPPALPVYEQPLCPGPGYFFTPGYWSWDDDGGYYWVPGTWVVAPVGLLWTPGYWGWNDGVYVWNAGYWGPEIGFYGGINYGFGYGGNGYYGGEWRGGTFFYNTAVTRVNTTTITNVYVNKTVIVNNSSHVAFNGGSGGVTARPTERQIAYARETHTPPIAAQTQQREEASKNRALFASTNHGRPTIAASAKPGEFSGKEVIAARAAGGTYHAPKMSPKEARASGPAGNRGEAARTENRKAEPRPAEKPAETRPSERAGNRSTAEPRPAEPRSAAPKTNEKNNANSNAMKRNSPENENKNERMATHENENRPAKPVPSHAGSKPPAEKPHAENESHAENRPVSKPASKPKTESRPSTPAAEKSRLPNEPRTESKPAARPSAPRESAPKASAPKPSPARESAPKAEHNAAPARAPKPAPAPKPQKPNNEPKEPKGI